MNNVQIVKKRLKDLKQLSQNLKKTSESKQFRDQNINIVRVIMNLTKDVTRPNDHEYMLDNHDHDVDNLFNQTQLIKVDNKLNNKNNNISLNLQSIKLTKQQQSRNKSNISNNLIIPTTHKTKQRNSHNSRNSYNSLNSQARQQQQQTKQLIVQKQHRLRLQKQNKQLRQKLLQLQQKIQQIKKQKTIQESKQRISKNLQSLSIQQQIIANYKYKHLSYFKITDVVGIFLTKIKINENDYNKIEYGMGEIKLNLNNIQVKLYSKYRQSYKNNNNNTNNNNNPINDVNINTNGIQNKNYSQKITKLDLTDLFAVDYIDSEIMVLKFKQEGDVRYLFVKFNDYQHRRKWDLGVYINFIILQSLNKDKMFMDQSFIVGFMNKDSPQNKNMQQKIISFDSEFQKQIDEKINNLKAKANLSNQQQQIMRQFYRQHEKTTRISAKIKQLGLNKKLDLQVEGQGFGLRRLFTRGSKNQGLQSSIKLNKQKSHLQILEQIKKSKEQQQINKKMQQNEKIKREQQLEKQRIRKKNQQVSFAKNTLKKGMYMTKYAEGALNPHDKRVFLSQDQAELCWQDRGDKQKQYKSININDIVSVNLGEIGPGIAKHVQKKDRLPDKCYLLIKLKDEKRKQLEFGMKVMDLMHDFAENLTIFVKSLHETAANV